MWVVSLGGLACGIFGIVHHDPAALLVSLACDVADGELARMLRASTAAGAALDFSIDTALGGALALAVWPPLLALPVAWQTATGGRYSGRAAMTAIAIFGWAR